MKRLGVKRIFYCASRQLKRICFGIILQRLFSFALQFGLLRLLFIESTSTFRCQNLTSYLNSTYVRRIFIPFLKLDNVEPKILSNTQLLLFSQTLKEYNRISGIKYAYYFALKKI